MRLPAINLRRTYLIARRDYLGYIRTWGFWISFFLPFIFGAFGIVASSWNIDLEPTRYEAIYDETGKHADAIKARHAHQIADRERRGLERLTAVIASGDQRNEILRAYDTQGMDAAIAILDEKYPGLAERMRLPQPSFLFVDLPGKNLDELKTLVNGGGLISYDGEPVVLSGVLHLTENEGVLNAAHWSTLINSEGIKSFYSRYFQDRSVDQYLASGGLSRQGLESAKDAESLIASFDPSKELNGGADSQEVSDADFVPYAVAAAMTVFLWLTIFSGSYMLLTSMLEEKLNKLLEMMLASTRLSEIIFGKLLGVAALTFTAMLPYLSIGAMVAVFIMVKGDPEVAAEVSRAFSPKMLIFFPLFLFLGYIFYGAFFIAMGTLANSMQDAQTLTTPIMLILSTCVLVVPLGLTTPNSPILTAASWFPLSAPFAAIIRLPSDPPWWELILSALFVFIMALVVIWFASRIFRYGVLSGAGLKGIQSWIARVVLRRKTIG